MGGYSSGRYRTRNRGNIEASCRIDLRFQAHWFGLHGKSTAFGRFGLLLQSRADRLIHGIVEGSLRPSHFFLKHLLDIVIQSDRCSHRRTFAVRVSSPCYFAKYWRFSSLSMRTLRTDSSSAL